MPYWQTNHFKALQRAWYDQLRKIGFEDAEQLVGGELVLKQSAAHPYRHCDALEVGSRASYFYALGSLVQREPFRSDIDRLILTMRSEGAKITHIVEALKQCGMPRCRGTIRYTIRKYEMTWGMRTYTPKQLNKKLRSTA